MIIKMILHLQILFRYLLNLKKKGGGIIQDVSYTLGHSISELILQSDGPGSIQAGTNPHRGWEGGSQLRSQVSDKSLENHLWNGVMEAFPLPFC